MEYSPFSLEVEQFGLLKACRELGVAMVAYSPLSASEPAGGNILALYRSADSDRFRSFQVVVF